VGFRTAWGGRLTEYGMGVKCNYVY
jgi:hypothetical protein